MVARRGTSTPARSIFITGAQIERISVDYKQRNCRHIFSSIIIKIALCQSTFKVIGKTVYCTLALNRKYPSAHKCLCQLVRLRRFESSSEIVGRGCAFRCPKKQSSTIASLMINSSVSHIYRASGCTLVMRPCRLWGVCCELVNREFRCNSASVDGIVSHIGTQTSIQNANGSPHCGHISMIYITLIHFKRIAPISK